LVAHPLNLLKLGGNSAAVVSGEIVGETAAVLCCIDLAITVKGPVYLHAAVRNLFRQAACCVSSDGKSSCSCQQAKIWGSVPNLPLPTVCKFRLRASKSSTLSEILTWNHLLGNFFNCANAEAGP
jgi:hypothetical protein